MIWKVPRMWEGGDVWIIGGGPSVSKQFGIPESVVIDVRTGNSLPSVYSPYMKRIHKKHIIGVNVAYMIGDWMDIIFFGDSGFLLKYQQSIAKYPGMKVSCHPRADNLDWVKFIPMDAEYVEGITSNPNKVSWNGNSGAAAISVAAHAGAKRIILLGFDMKLDNKRQHWHDVYKRGEIVEDKRLMKLPFERHMIGFPQIAKDARALGISIWNVSPDSAIEEFPKVSLTEMFEILKINK